MKQNDIYYMKKAISAAIDAKELDEIPIGACLVNSGGEIIALKGNRSITGSDPTAHAEILALREGAQKVGNYRLTEYVLYTTIEPCVMCAGALVNARIKRVVFGAFDERFGAVKTLFNICDNRSLNHQIEITSGVMADECKKLIQDFFNRKRKKG